MDIHGSRWTKTANQVRRKAVFLLEVKPWMIITGMHWTAPRALVLMTENRR